MLNNEVIENSAKSKQKNLGKLRCILGIIANLPLMSGI
jgi:hypothetical protein